MSTKVVLGIKVINIKEQLRNHQIYWLLRRSQDIVFSGLVLVVLSPILLIVYILIFLDNPYGSPIFRRILCGRNGKPFKVYKFRSMYIDAERKLEELFQNNEMDGPAFNIKDDPRITRIGNFISRTSIDELPQLVNILKGDMNIVGPRPALPREVE